MINHSFFKYSSLLLFNLFILACNPTTITTQTATPKFPKKFVLYDFKRLVGGSSEMTCEIQKNVDAYILNPIALIDHGKFTDLSPTMLSSESFLKEHFTANKLISVYSEGQMIGNVQMKHHFPTSCVSSSLCAFPQFLPHHPDTALASDFAGLGLSSPQMVRALQPKESTFVQKAIQQLFTQEQPKGIKTLDEIQITSAKNVVVSLKPQDNLLIATYQAGDIKKFDPECSQDQIQSQECLPHYYHWLAVLDPHQEKILWSHMTDAYEKSGSQEFLGSLDLNGDGVLELVFRIHHYEGSSYEIYQRTQNDGWQILYGGGESGC